MNVAPQKVRSQRYFPDWIRHRLRREIGSHASRDVVLTLRFALSLSHPKRKVGAALILWVLSLAYREP